MNIELFYCDMHRSIKSEKIKDKQVKQFIIRNYEAKDKVF